jgi:TolA-binding protein
MSEEERPRIKTNFVSHQAEESSTPITKQVPVLIVFAVIGIGILFGAFSLVMYVINMDMTTAMKNVDVIMQRPSQKDGNACVDVQIANYNPAAIRETTFKYIIKDGAGAEVATGNITIPCAIPAGDSRTFPAVKLCPLTAKAGRMQAELVSLKYKKPNLPDQTASLFVEAAALKDREALDFWKTIAQQAPDFPAAFVGLGQSLAASNDSPNAIKAYQKALRIDPDDENAHYNLGVLLYYNKDMAGAKKEMEEAAKLEPDDPAVISSLKQFNAQMPQVENASEVK